MQEPPVQQRPPGLHFHHRPVLRRLLLGGEFFHRLSVCTKINSHVDSASTCHSVASDCSSRAQTAKFCRRIGRHVVCFDLETLLANAAGGRQAIQHQRRVQYRGRAVRRHPIPGRQQLLLRAAGGLHRAVRLASNCVVTELRMPRQCYVMSKALRDVWAEPSGFVHSASLQPAGPTCVQLTGAILGCVHRSVFYRERAAGLYSVVPYAAAQGVIELPYIAVQCIGYW